MIKSKKTLSKPSAPSHRPASGLGRGLTDIIKEGGRTASTALPVTTSGIRQVELSRLTANPHQPRTRFVEEPLDELTNSIREKGLISPIIVRPRQGLEGQYEIIAGERRFRACKKIGLTAIPVIVKMVSDVEAYEISLIENLQRENLDPVEEARGYQRLAKDFSLTQEQIAQKVGRNRATVANALRLLELPEEIQGYLVQGRLTTGHAKAILGLPSEDQRIRLAHDVLKQGLNVRQTEQVAIRFRSGALKVGKGGKKQVSRGGQGISTNLMAIQDALQQKLATKVHIHPSGNGGRIEVLYYTSSDLDRILELLQIRL